MRKLMLITSLLIVLVLSMPFTFAATLSLTYDANGNLVTGDGKYREYDGFNHLVLIRDGNNATGIPLENYTWHPLEERIVIKDVYLTNGSWKETVYYPSKEFVSVENASGIFDYKYIYQNGQLIAQELVGGSTHFMLNDHKGSVAVVVNSSGAAVEETFYSPFGEIISGGSTTRFDYEGKEYDSVVGDYDFHARKVNAQWGMFTQPDTLLPNVYDPQQLNRYAFERNNPYKYVDENGRNPVLFTIAGIAVTYTAIETAIDIASFISSLYALYKDPESNVNKMALVLDTADLLSGPASFPGPSGTVYRSGSQFLKSKGTESALKFWIVSTLYRYEQNPQKYDPYMSALQYMNPNLAPQIIINLYNYFIQDPNLNNQQQIADQTSQAYSKAESIARELGGGGGSGGGGDYTWGVEPVGNTLQVIVVIPVDSGDDSDDD